MKKIFILCGIVVLLGVGALIWSRSGPEHFGPAFMGMPQVSVTDLLSNPAKYEDKDVRVQASITKQ